MQYFSSMLQFRRHTYKKSNKNAQLHAKGLWDKLKEKKDFPTTGKDRKKRQRISYEGKDDGTFHPCD